MAKISDWNNAGPLDGSEIIPIIQNGQNRKLNYTPVPSIATGGTEGQVLSKASATDFDTEWVNPPSSGTTVHGELTGRDVEDSHPQSAITGLTAALAGKADTDEIAPFPTGGAVGDLFIIRQTATGFEYVAITEDPV